MRLAILSIVIIHVVTFGATLTGGQTATQPGVTGIVVPVALSAADGEEPSALGFDLTFDETWLTPVNMTAGPSAIAANKSVGWYSLSPSAVRVLVSGLNQNVIPDGDVVLASFDVASGVTAISLTVAVVNTSVSDPFGVVIASSGLPGYVHVRGPESWVDFDHTGAEWGTPTFPFNTVAEGRTVLNTGGTLKLLSGETAETPNLDTPMRVEAVSGPARLGVPLVPPQAPLAARVIVKHETPSAAHPPVFFRRSSMIGQTAGDIPRDTPVARRVAFGAFVSLPGQSEFVHETVLPVTTDDEGRHIVLPNETPALRLRGSAAIDSATLWTGIFGISRDRFALSFQAAGSLENDLWVLFQPRTAPEEGKTVILLAGAFDILGDEVPVVAATFCFMPRAEQYNGEPVKQPVPGGDYTPLDAGENVIPIETIPARPYAYLTVPCTVYETPRRVWIPLSPDLDPAKATVEYRLDTGAWYPGESVEGWLVPEPYLRLMLPHVTYLGSRIRHGGYFRLSTTAGRR